MERLLHIIDWILAVGGLAAALLIAHWVSSSHSDLRLMDRLKLLLEVCEESSLGPWTIVFILLLVGLALCIPYIVDYFKAAA